PLLECAQRLRQAVRCDAEDDCGTGKIFRQGCTEARGQASRQAGQRQESGYSRRRISSRTKDCLYLRGAFFCHSEKRRCCATRNPYSYEPINSRTKSLQPTTSLAQSSHLRG